MTAITYIGKELDLFAQAVNWKSYLHDLLAPHLGQRVLEVGAGQGTTTAALCDGNRQEWVCLEPDPKLRAELDQRCSDGRIPPCCRVHGGVVADLRPAHPFDSVLYVDVIEHIADDRHELAQAAQHLAPGGALIVVAPAHPFLFSAFDRAIGHHRRYSRRTLTAVTPPAGCVEMLRYLDSAGMLASLANRVLLRQSLPSEKQILFWDRRLVPLSRRIDPLLGHRVGKSVVCIWKKNK
ncbi:MAG: methyltransferase type 12 [Lentisphaerae bacterium RIFOXYB12_FULL_65_16]|nr:MAG: methyltransferase type 12 [Lentisphaerae bacterium RIFOXYA12_64_32]OGV90118.1 MAG: methyltransferase type 12 [Lentisphaerae bacterium RIFOXYB12_FULL_65_16]